MCGSSLTILLCICMGMQMQVCGTVGPVVTVCVLYTFLCMPLCVCVPIVLISVCIFDYLCSTVCGSRGSGCMTVSKSVQPQRFYVESSVHPCLCPRVLKSNKTVATGMCPGVDGRVQLLFYTDVEVWSCERYLIENILCKVFTQI